MKSNRRVTMEERLYTVEAITINKNAHDLYIKPDDEMWLCRCGGSTNKPFCDGTHMRKIFK